MIERIVAGRIGREAARGTVFESLIHRKDHQLSCAGQFTAPQQSGDVGLRACIVAAVPTENLLHPISHFVLRLDQIRSYINRHSTIAASQGSGITRLLEYWSPPR